MSGYTISPSTTGVQVSCPGWDWGLCNGHNFETNEQAETWIAANKAKDTE